MACQSSPGHLIEREVLVIITPAAVWTAQVGLFISPDGAKQKVPYQAFLFLLPSTLCHSGSSGSQLTALRIAFVQYPSQVMYASFYFVSVPGGIRFFVCFAAFQSLQAHDSMVRFRCFQRGWYTRLMLHSHEAPIQI